MEISGILRNFNYKKSLGQNFITDTNLLSAIALDSGAQKTDTVVEIGTGAGTLTRALSSVAGRVITFEVDRSLSDIHNETLAGLGNVEVHFSDVLKLSDGDIATLIGKADNVGATLCRPFLVVANLPYYITTPLIMRFLESNLPVTSLTVMVQKEVADRLCALPNTEDYGAIGCQVNLRADVKSTRTVSRRMFYPSPNVDSAVVKITINKDKFKELGDFDLEKASAVIKSAFSMRRKTLVNCLSNSFKMEKETARNLLLSLNLPETVRGEALSIPDLIKISRLIP